MLRVERARGRGLAWHGMPCPSNLSLFTQRHLDQYYYLLCMFLFGCYFYCLTSCYYFDG